MTVKELIEYLKECNPDLPVAICTDDFFGYYSEVSEDDIFADTVHSSPTKPGDFSTSRKWDAMVIRKV